MINIREEILNAKNNNIAYFHKGFYNNTPTWDDFLNCVFKESQVENLELARDISNLNAKDVDQRSKGNVLIIDDVYFSPQVNNLEYFPRLSNFISEFLNINGILLGVSGPKVSVGPRHVAPHSDKWDGFSLQCQGTSIWKISCPDNGYNEEFQMSSGDLLYFPQETMHELYCNEPRAGIIFNLPDARLDPKEYATINNNAIIES